MENNEQVQTLDVTYQGAKKSKLFLAKFVDFCFFIILSFITAFTTLSITVMTPGYNDVLNKAQQIQLDSKIYVKDEKEDEVLKLTAFLNRDKDMKADEKAEKLDEALTYFFNSPEFFKNDEGIKIYDNYKKDATKDGKNLFILVDGKYAENTEAGIIPSVYVDFYSDILNTKATAYLQQSASYHHLSLVSTRIFVIEIITMVVVTYIILFVLIPLLSFNNHNTLGMKTFKIGAINKDGFSVSNKKMALIVTFDALVVSLLSAVTFLIPLFISLGFMMYRQDNKNLSGYFFDYYFVDISSKKVFKNPDEYSANVQFVEKHDELYENTPLQIEEDEKSED